MESLSDTLWDVVICGTGLQQSLLALSLSRSGKNILHIDPNEYYGGPDAAFSLQEAEAWVDRLADPSTANRGFRSASVTRPEGSTGLSFPRAYSIALSPQLIHSRSKLLSQLVSSRAYRQVEFLAVGSFFVFNPAPGPDQKPSLARIPSTREDIGFDTTIPLKGKRSLMKFLKFVQDYQSEASTEIWKPYADSPLTDFLQKHFKIDAQLQTYIIALTLSLDGKITTQDGLAILFRHLTSMGLFGLGFAAVYPKWGGISEIAQVACRAGAVGGAVYMLGTGIKTHESMGDELQLHLSNGETVKAKKLVRSSDSVGEPGISRLVAIVGSTLNGQFEALVEGAPQPAVSVIAFPSGSLHTSAGKVSEYPVHMTAHSSDTGECPVGQSILYLTTVATANSKELLKNALDAFLEAMDEDPRPQTLFELYYEQTKGAGESTKDGAIFNLPGPSLSPCFDDAVLDPVQEAWKEVLGEVDTEYMTFTDREGVTDEDEMYD
ncbi:rab proteins geranylgeranyltransferase component A [Echria macrotheca]|uniref:Rab proteins geranylgeranyltransferase n=1 Tax=Echria macrotheca TaxID=438768 RepID=A0AAJ0BKP6_9PEZI|nr:rab proteins geranylgeranyltransferase component A [Echria macrotheca]